MNFVFRCCCCCCTIVVVAAAAFVAVAVAVAVAVFASVSECCCYHNNIIFHNTTLGWVLAAGCDCSGTEAAFLAPMLISICYNNNKNETVQITMISTYRFTQQLVWRLSLLGRDGAGDLRQHRRVRLRVRPGVLLADVGAGQRLHQEAIRVRTEVSKVFFKYFA